VSQVSLTVNLNASLGVNPSALFKPLGDAGVAAGGRAAKGYERAMLRAVNAVAASELQRTKRATEGEKRLTQEARARAAIAVAEGKVAIANGKVRGAQEANATAQVKARAKAAADAARVELAAAKQMALETQKQVDAARAKASIDRAALAFVLQGERTKTAEMQKQTALVRQRTAREARDDRRAGGGEGGGGRILDGGRAVVRDAGRLARAGARIAGSVARGAGLDFSLEDGVRRRLATAREAQDIANQSGDPTDTAGSAKTAAGIADMVRTVSASRGLEQEELLKLIRGYQELTGTLPKTAAELDMLAKNAKVSGTSLEDQGKLTGTLINALGGAGVAKEGDVDALNRYLIQSGRGGAVELKNFAQLIPRLTALVGNFNPTQMAVQRAQALRGTTGQEATDDDRKMAQIIEGATAMQLARAGTAGTARDAINSYQAIVQQVKTPANRKKIEAAGVRVFDTDATGRTVQRSPFEMIADAAVRTNFDEKKVSQIFGGVNVQRFMKNFRDTYTKAKDAHLKAHPGDKKGAEQAGVAAMQEQVDKFMGPKAFTAGARDDQVAQLESTEAEKLAKTRERLRQQTEEIGARLLVALEPLIPHLERLGAALPGLVDKIVANPGTAIAAAFAGLLGKAAVEQAVVSGVSALFSGGAAGGLGGALALALAALGPFAVAVGAAALAIGALLATLPSPELGKKRWYESNGDDSKGDVIAETSLPIAGTPFAKNKNSQEKRAPNPYERNLMGWQGELDGSGQSDWVTDWTRAGNGVERDAPPAAPPPMRADDFAQALARTLGSGVLSVKVVDGPLTAPTAGRDLAGSPD
jgi:hypothetical protein